MEFRFDISTILRKPISVFTADSLPKNPALLERAIEIIDELGVASAKAQGLRGPVTTSTKLRSNPTHRVYVLKTEILLDDTAIAKNPHAYWGHPNHHRPSSRSRRRSLVVGIIKVGIKNLFVMDEFGRQLQVSPLCVLDFYVHEGAQRQGHGKTLFDYMLEIEMQRPGHLAYDRPSPKFIAFLKKHYSLTDCTGD
ncbi:Alpha-tubulin N-acetyltransferase 1 [Thoreauomyces humboldtii]|nr:Alpha-tubulin N-acetyltransferase 1 [Thoreauomyces humboldtii]